MGIASHQEMAALKAPAALNVSGSPKEEEQIVAWLGFDMGMGRLENHWLIILHLSFTHLQLWMTMDHRRFIHQAAHCTELVVSTLNFHPSIGHSGKAQVVCCKMKESSSNKKIDQHFRSLDWNMPIFLKNAWELTHTLSRCVSFRQNVFTLLHVLIFYAVFFFRRSGLHIPSAFEGVFFSLSRLHRPCLGCWFVSELVMVSQ